jgi:EmrB/QacA subfamily drug resistance transporter
METKAKKQAEGTRAKFWILMTTSLVSSLIMLDSNIVAVSLPAIGQSLHANFAEIEWVISAYLLAYAALLLAAGAFADIKGRKKSMVIGLFIFGIASAACGIAPSSAILNISRAVQGVGGAMLLTAALAIITNTFEGAERTRAFAVWGACLGVALTAGPILGGFITHYFGWRWVFLVNVPLCIMLIFATFRVINESSDPGARKFDFLGILTFTPGLFLMVWALIDGNDAGWASTAILARFAGAVIFVIAFIIVEKRQIRPMVDLKLFQNSTFLGSVYAMTGYGATAQVMVFYLPLFLQNAYGFEPAKAGLSMLPFALPMVLAPRLTGKLGAKFSGRTMLTAGLAVTLLGNLLFWLVAKSGLGFGYFTVSMLVAGTGAGILNGETVKVLQGAVPPERAGMASGLASTTRFIGILVGVAALGAVLSDTAKSKFAELAIPSGLKGDPLASAAKKVTSGDIPGMLKGVPPAIRDQVHQAALHAYSAGFGLAALLAAGVSLIACVLTWHYVRSEDTAPAGKPVADKGRHEPHCKLIDCRHPI